MRFTDRDRATVRALGRVVLPGGTPGLPSSDDAGVADAVGGYVEALPRDVAAVLTAGLRTLSVLPVLSGRRGRLRNLSPSDRAAFVHRLAERGGLRGVLFDLFRQLVLDTWASREPVARAIGYDGSCLADAEDRKTLIGPFLPADVKDGYRPGVHVIPRLSPVSFPDIGDRFVRRSDVVVVGSGAGGAVVAAELAALGLSVAVVEEGAYFTSRDFTGPPFERFMRMCRGGGMTVALGRPMIPVPIGRAVGGTTVVNSGTCFRTPRKVLDEWEHRFGIEGLGAEELDPIFDRVEAITHVRPVPWEVMGNNGLIAHRGARALGLTGGPILRNIVDCHGCGQCAFGCPSDAKQAMHLSYLPRAEAAGATIFSRVRADRVLTSGGRAAGIAATVLDDRDRPVGRATFLAPAVVVSAGAIYTPLLLRASGLGRRGGQVGRNLRLHPASAVVARFDEDVSSWRGTLQSYFIDTLHESHGVMLEATNPMPSVSAGALPGFGPELEELLAGYRHLASLGFLVSDTSAGRVRRLPRGRPVITYRLNRRDLRSALAGLKLTAEVLFAAGARRVLIGLPGLQWAESPRDLDYLEEGAFRPEHLHLLAFHPMGTARMSADPASSVCDPWGRVRGAPGAWVADASVFPSCLGVNPQITIMAFATRTARALAAAR